jgi:hypothetical protein
MRGEYKPKYLFNTSLRIFIIYFNPSTHMCGRHGREGHHTYLYHIDLTVLSHLSIDRHLGPNRLLILLYSLELSNHLLVDFKFLNFRFLY